MVSRDESERWRRSEAIADACLELPTERRAHFLVDRCRDDSELLEAALDLVLAAEEAADIPTPVWRPRAGDVAPQTFDAAEDIDRFEVGEKLGEGGMGIVYRAQQTEPVERQVALKVARHPIHGEGQTRLAIERQAMAKLQHPNIAQVLEAGSTAEGHPYFAMELVEGARPITQYCDRRRLGVDSRLRLFLEVCSGVQHAHQKGIVHRDLKPSNIVVRSPDPGDTTPTAKIIDFGIAKVLEDEALPPSLTGGQILGTPAYLSPESLSGAAADTRTDVYSLGVVLFELLVGRQPFPRRDGETPLMHLQRIVDSPGAPRLSRAWSQLDSAARSERARALGTSPRALDRRFRGDLQWILQAALAVDPDARYATVAELASDLGRFLRNEPVLVGPPSRRYRLRKFVSRHRTASISALLLTLSLVGGLVARTFEADRANREARDAALARDENARMLDFVLDLFAASDPAESQGRELSARDVLKRGTEQLNSGDLDESPRAKARLLGEIAEIHWALGDPREGLTLAEQALALNREDLGALHPETAGSLHLTGTLASVVGDYDRSEELLLKALTLRRRLLGEGSPKVADTLANLGAIQEETSRFEDALESYRNALAIYREDEPDSLAVANVLNNLGVLYLEMDRSPDAEQSHRRAARIREDRLGPRHPAVLESWRNLGESLVHQRRYGEALVYLRQALEASREVLGPDHPQVGHGVNNLGHALRSLGDWQEAEAAYRRAEDIYGQAMGSADHPWVAYPLTNLGLTYSDQGRYADAIRVLRRADAIRTARDVDELTLQTSRLYLGASLRAAGQLDDAEPLLRTAADRFEATASGGMLHRISLVELGLLSLEQGAPSEAQDLLELALDLSEEHRGPTATWAGAQFGLAQIARARGHEKRARRLAEEVFSVVEGLPADHRRRVDVGRFLDGP